MTKVVQFVLKILPRVPAKNQLIQISLREQLIQFCPGEFKEPKSRMESRPSGWNLMESLKSLYGALQCPFSNIAARTTGAHSHDAGVRAGVAG